MRLVDADILLTAFPKGENEIFRTSAVRGTIDACPIVDAVPVTWIEGEIKWLKEMDNPFATMSAGQIEAMLKRWKDGDRHD